MPNAKDDHHWSNNCWENLKIRMVGGGSFSLLRKDETTFES
jgi:hypothetical protein